MMMLVLKRCISSVTLLLFSLIIIDSNGTEPFTFCHICSFSFTSVPAVKWFILKPCLASSHLFHSDYNIHFSFQISHCCLHCAFLSKLFVWKWFRQYALYNAFKKFLYNQTVFQHVLVVAAAIIGELYKLRHLCCKDCLSYYYAHAIWSNLHRLST